MLGKEVESSLFVIARHRRYWNMQHLADLYLFEEDLLLAVPHNLPYCLFCEGPKPPHDAGVKSLIVSEQPPDGVVRLDINVIGGSRKESGEL